MTGSKIHIYITEKKKVVCQYEKHWISRGMKGEKVLGEMCHDLSIRRTEKLRTET
jgi:hypothetical protein